MAIGLYTLAPLLAPALGPLLGGWIVERATWNWCFYSITLFGIAVEILVFFWFKETFGPRLLQLKATKLRIETGNSQLRTKFEEKDLSIASVLKTSLIRVIVLLTTQCVIIFLSIYFAMIYGIIYLMLVSRRTVTTCLKTRLMLGGSPASRLYGPTTTTNRLASAA